MQILNNIKKLFTKPDSGTGIEPERLARELLRENLGSVTVDMFGVSDPLVLMEGDERKLYLKHCADLAKDEVLMGLIRMLINQQVVRTMHAGSKQMDPKFDFAGAMKIDGIAIVKDALDVRASMHFKEAPKIEEFNPYGVFPEL